MRTQLADLMIALDQQRPCVYCAVVETRGSTPQKAGAAMLVFADGGQRGTLGGGCVEAEVKQRALRVLAGGADRPEVLTFCLDDNYGWDDGLICGGRMTILADPLTSDRAGAYYRSLYQCIEEGSGCTQTVALAPSLGLAAGDRYLFDASGHLVAQTADTTVPGEILQGLPPLAERPAPASRRGIAYLPVLPRITLLIVGGGHVGQAVARLAAEVDFDIWVLDDRASYASRERFPSAQRLLIGEIGPTLQQLVPELTPSTYCLVMTRGHSHDEEALYHLAGSPASYVGMIGSKRKIKLIFEDLIAKGVPWEALARVHAPLGLTIGSQTVPEIAVSIVAELIACRNLSTTESRPQGQIQRDSARLRFAVLPAAGKSTRMGRPKLALPLGEHTVLEHIIIALRLAKIEHILVVVGPHVRELTPLAENAGAHVCCPVEEPTGMRSTVEHGLRWLEERFQLRPDDAWLLAPADHPTLTAGVVRTLEEAWKANPEYSIFVPTHQGRRGHPLLLTWAHVASIRAQPADQGLNIYVRQRMAETLEVPVADPDVLGDLDTPEEYERLQRRWQG